MEYRQLGNSGLMVSAMSPGTMTFGDTASTCLDTVTPWYKLHNGGGRNAAVWEPPIMCCWIHIDKPS